MERTFRLALLGGDARQAFAARRLARERETAVWGLPSLAERYAPARTVADWREAVDGAEAVLLPLPCSEDGVRVRSPFWKGEGIRLDVLLGRMRGKLLLGGRLPTGLFDRAQEQGVRCVDYGENEVLQLRNALPTVEGAISIALEELPVTLCGCSVAVMGYGRIGSLLAERLFALGARVSVYARREEQRALAELYGAHAFPLSSSGEGEEKPFPVIAEDCRAIFNTVPSCLFTDEALAGVPRDCILIDLASPPGGIDRSAAAARGLRTVWGSALPGRCFPESAGEILGRTLEEILDSEERAAFSRNGGGKEGERC